jgi:hypothetical protein
MLNSLSTVHTPKELAGRTDGCLLYLLIITFCTLPVILFFRKYKPGDKEATLIDQFVLIVCVSKILPDDLLVKYLLCH